MDAQVKRPKARPHVEIVRTPAVIRPTREEAERLIRETMEKKALVVKQGNTRIEAVCGKCGAPNRVQAEKGATRVKYVCKQCGDKQVTL
jgi:transposase-like protein